MSPILQATQPPVTGRRALSVRRYHTWPTIQQQTVADHTCHVLRIYSETFGRPSGDVVQYILWHDAAEAITGDAPFDGKRVFPELKRVLSEIEKEVLPVVSGGLVTEIASRERLRVKFADLAEMVEFGREEMRLGNEYYGLPVVEKVLKALFELVGEMDSEDRQSCYDWVRIGGY